MGHNHHLPADWSACIAAIGLLIENIHGINPCENNGSRFDSDVFSMHAFSWSDDDQSWNFKCGEIEVSWYKYHGRGEQCNDATIAASILDVMQKCVAAISSGQIA
jgi:hypothetical protein